MTAPRYLTARTGPTLGPSAARFIETLCRSPRDSVGGAAGSPIRLRPWQRNLLDGLLMVDMQGRLAHRNALVGMPRKNGKTALGAGLALWSLTTGAEGGEVYSVAGDREQARLCFGTARRMVEMSPELSRSLRCLRDAIECPATGSVYKVRSAEAGLSEGLSPSFVVFDEVHVQPTRELWDVMALGAGARAESLLLGITTAGIRTDRTGRDSLAYSLHQHGIRVASGELDDPTFFFAWWGAPDDADHRDPAVWRAANPGYGDIVAAEDFASVVQRTPEAEFRRKRLNAWTDAAQTWLPAGTWEACEDRDQTIEPGATVVLGFDGSRSNDSTALVAVTVSDRPHIDVVAAWERPAGGDAHRARGKTAADWEVPVAEVEETIRAACRRYRVTEIAADPYLWQRSLQLLADEGLPVMEFPQTPERMGRATQRFYEAVLTRGLTHSGHPVLTRHIRAAVTKEGSAGTRITKEAKWSGRKIDAAIAAVIAFDRAARESTTPPQVWNLNEIVAELRAERQHAANPQPAPEDRPDGSRFIPFDQMPGRW